MTVYNLAPRCSLFHDDMLRICSILPDDFIDSVVTDPPYNLQFMGKAWDGDIAFRAETWTQVLRVMKPGAHLVAFGAPRNYHRLAVAIEDANFEIRDSLMWIFGKGYPKSYTSLKPAYEPIILARKPCSESTVAANVQRWGTGAINVDACRIATADSTMRTNRAEMGYHGGNLAKEYTTGSENGRWPANVCHDGSADVIEAFPDTAPAKAGKPRQGANGKGWGMTSTGAEYNDAGGSAARFFYSAKASKADRADSKHPTVKPIALKQWLARMITPKGGLVLDPFAGSGTTGVAATREGFGCLLIERESEYVADICRRFVDSTQLS